MIETPFYIVMAVAAVFVALAFRPLRNRTHDGDERDREDLAATNRRIEEIEREAEKRD